MSTHTHTHTNTHTHTHIYIYIYVCVCVCVKDVAKHIILNIEKSLNKKGKGNFLFIMSILTLGNYFDLIVENNIYQILSIFRFKVI